MRPRWSILAALLLLAAACSGSVAAGGDAGSTGAGDDETNDASCGPGCIVPQGFVLATMGPGPSSPTTVCHFGIAQSWLMVGAPTPSIPDVVQDGGSQNGAPVAVACSVIPVNAGFDVSLQISVGGTGGGGLTITSPAGVGAVTMAGAQGITASWQSETFGPASESDCTIAFTYEGQPVYDDPPVAAGRIWGHLSCPQALFDGETVVGPDGGTTTVHCDGEADFLFEQCTE
jgi:hypothetical protein